MRPYKDYLTTVPESDRRAIFLNKSHEGIEWNGGKYNLSTLTEHIFQTYGKTRTKVNPTELWEIEGETQSLYERWAALPLDGSAPNSIEEVVSDAVGEEMPI
jgi:hypothetical protein